MEIFHETSLKMIENHIEISIFIYLLPVIFITINKTDDEQHLVLSRFYWTDNFLYIRAVNAEFPYGFEYLGNTGRLVITPLTDRFVFLFLF